MGASRTDSGVHAIEQVVKITTEKSLHFENILSLLNRELPTSIRCLAINSAASDFKLLTVEV
jgi:tRNA pseudouridine(38-40) synthase